MTRAFACNAVLFDLDGVLADSTQAVNRAWEAWSRLHGVDRLHAIQVGHGRKTIDAVRELAPEADPQESFQEMERFEESFLDTVVAVDGAPQFVARVCALGLPWAVATSSSRRIAIPRLQRCGIPSPPVLVTADDVTIGKPDPAPYQKAAAGLHLEACDCIVFEDAPSGITAAHRAGARVIAIGAHARALQADAFSPDFTRIRLHGTAQRAQVEVP